MSQPTFDQDFWQQLWSKTLREHPDKVARRPPNALLMAEAAQLPAGRALDAGCGHGADTLWLAAHGWQVTAVDFSAAALAHGRSMAEAAGADIAARVDWLESDLATWAAAPGHYGTARSIPAPERPRPQQIRCRSASRLRSLRSIPSGGRWSSQRSVPAPSRAPGSMP